MQGRSPAGRVAEKVNRQAPQGRAWTRSACARRQAQELTGEPNKGASDRMGDRVLIAMGAFNEPVRGMFEGTVTFERLGYLVFGMLLVVSVVGPVLIIRARHRDPQFRGVISELTRLVAFGEALTMATAWVIYYFTAPI